MSEPRCPHYAGLPAKCCPKCVKAAHEDEEFRARHRRAYGGVDPSFEAFMHDLMNRGKPS